MAEGRGKQRYWSLGPNPETGIVDEDELARKMVEVGALLNTIGGVVTVAPIRVEIPSRVSGHYVTVGVHFAWDSYVPAMRPSEPEPEPEDPSADIPDDETYKISVEEPQPVES